MLFVNNISVTQFKTINIFYRHLSNRYLIHYSIVYYKKFFMFVKCTYIQKIHNPYTYRKNMSCICENIVYMYNYLKAFMCIYV